jgi:hypothetical protein
VHFFIISPLSFRAENNPDQTRVENETEGVVGPRTYTSKYVTMVCACYIHTEERWVMETLH